MMRRDVRDRMFREIDHIVSTARAKANSAFQDAAHLATNNDQDTNARLEEAVKHQARYMAAEQVRDRIQKG